MERSAASRIVLWTIVCTSGGLGLVFATFAVATTRATVATDVCATGYDNGWVLPTMLCFLVANAAMLVRFVHGTVPSQQHTGLAGVVGLGITVVVSFLATFLAVGGYRWRCPFP